MLRVLLQPMLKQPPVKGELQFTRLAVLRPGVGYNQLVLIQVGDRSGWSVTGW